MAAVDGRRLSRRALRIRSSALGAIALLVVAGIGRDPMAAAGKTVTFGGSFVLDDFARFLKMLAFGGSAAAILMSLDLRQERDKQQVRISDPDAARGRGHGHDDLGRPI